MLRGRAIRRRRTGPGPGPLVRPEAAHTKGAHTKGTHTKPAHTKGAPETLGPEDALDRRPARPGGGQPFLIRFVSSVTWL